ncbi:hypothetical protein [Methylomonas koyamae]|uniref:hypothetical protein n=1 Tax=Methylomonas koyamae TaxID=702114 RepID=UPI001642E843|nr:hypothetical protein [Methylomonas koyamae]
MKDSQKGITRIRTAPYLTTDGSLRFCVSAPLLEPPVDFKEWYRPRQRRAQSSRQSAA